MTEIQLEFVSATHDDPLARPLLAELAVEYAQRYGGTPDAHLGWLPVPAAELAATAARGLLDFLTIDDTLMPQIGRSSRIHPDRLAGRADAVLVAARIAPATRHIGLIPVATVTHTEPFHVSKSIATLDFVS